MDLPSATVRPAAAEQRGQLRPAVAVATSVLVMLAFAHFGLNRLVAERQHNVYEHQDKQ